MNKYERSELHRQKYLKKLTLHQCVKCGTVDERTKAGGSTCEACAEKARILSKQVRDRRREAGVCIKCGGEDERTRAGLRMCVWCAKKSRGDQDRRNKAEQDKYRERKAAGLCPKCGGPLESGYSTCKKCRARNRASAIRVAQRRKDESNA